MKTYTIQYTDSSNPQYHTDSRHTHYQIELADNMEQAKDNFYQSQISRRGNLDGLRITEARLATEAENYLGSQLIMASAMML